MADPTGESKSEALRLDFDRRLMLQFRGSVITSDGGLLAYRELDDVFALTTTGGERLAEARTGKNRQHLLVGLLRQSVFGRLAGYEDVNDAERLCHDPAMRWVVGDKAITGSAASASQMGRFETQWLTRPENLAALIDLPGRWIDKVHKRRQPRVIVLDMDSSESETYGDQEGSAYNGHFGCTCYHPLFVFNYMLSRPVGRPPLEVRRYYASFTYQAQSWKKPRRVVAKVEWHPGELCPRVGFIVTNLARPAERIVGFYNHRGTCEQWIKEGKGAIKGTWLSCRASAANAVRL